MDFLQTMITNFKQKKNTKEDKNNHPGENEKTTAIEPDTNTTTLADKIHVNKNNDDLVTLVKDDDSEPYVNEDDQAH